MAFGLDGCEGSHTLVMHCGLRLDLELGIRCEVDAEA